METWKPVVGYEGYYEVSDRGRVRSVPRIVSSSSRNGGQRRRPSKILKANKKRNGYLSVDLCREGVIKTNLVHRIVAKAFCEKPSPDADQVNHINYNKTDNRASNLEWCTQSYNMRHMIKGGFADKSIEARRKRIRCVELGLEFPSSYQAAEWLNEEKFSFSKDVAGMSRKIRACAIKAQQTAYGYHWVDVNSEPSTTILKGSTPKRVEMGGPS